MSGLSLLWNVESRFTLLSSVLAFFGHKASRPTSGYQTMITFFISMIPSEIPIHFLLIQLVVLWIYLPYFIKKYYRRNSLLLDDSEDEQWRNNVKKGILAVGSVASFWSIFCFLKMSIENILSVYRFNSIMRRAGISSTGKHSSWSFRRLSIMLLPFAFLLKRNVNKISKVYATVPKTLKSTTANKKLKLDVYWHQNRK